MGALLLGIALAVLALAWVLAPLLRGAVPPSPEGTAPPLAEGPTALDVLREIEFDHATGKLAAEDYAKLRAEYTPRAVAELEASDSRAAAGRAVAAAASGTSDTADAAEQLIERARARSRNCSGCGPRPESDALFCSDCGRYLSAACLHCGATVVSDRSRFCTECGETLAA